MTTLRDLVDQDPIDMHAVEAHLDSLSSEGRVAETRSLGRQRQARLFDAAAGHRAVSLDHFVAPSLPPMHEVVHHGRNTLPAFSSFAKVFARPEAPDRPVLWGYNRAGGFVETVVGPGYFVARPLDATDEVLVDYLEVPPARLEAWPEILPNSARLSAFVYNGTQDVLRGVSNHVAIGRAFKAGKPMSAWFILCREGT
ncbi:MAG: hypothetical protein AAGF92_14005 [Myxococcota bacterium]